MARSITNLVIGWRLDLVVSSNGVNGSRVDAVIDGQFVAWWPVAS